MGNRFVFDKNFGKWCVENNRQDILDAWDYEKNDFSPFEIPFGTKMRAYFKCCDKNVHPSESKRILTIVENTHRKLICKQCQAEHCREDLTGQTFGQLTVIKFDEKRSKDSQRMPYWICKCSCGNEVSVDEYKLRKGNKTSCGRKNRHKNVNEDQEALNKLRRSGKYYKFRNDVIAKDNGKCIISGETDDIEVHHIYSFSFHPEYRYDVNCGVCISKKYHSTNCKDSFHSLYGTIDTTPEEFEEYVNLKRKELGINEHFDVYEYMNIEKTD